MVLFKIVLPIFYTLCGFQQTLSGENWLRSYRDMRDRKLFLSDFRWFYEVKIAYAFFPNFVHTAMTARRCFRVEEGHNTCLLDYLRQFGGAGSNLALFLCVRLHLFQYHVPTHCNWLNRCRYGNITPKIGISTPN